LVELEEARVIDQDILPEARRGPRFTSRVRQRGGSGGPISLLLSVHLGPRYNVSVASPDPVLHGG